MKTILTLCLALATLAGSAQVVPIVRNKFTTNNSTASVVINADILDATINSNKLDTATKNLLMGGTNQAYVAADLVVSNAVVSRVNGRGTNATFYLDSGGWFLAEQTTGLHLLGYNNAAWFGDTDAIISEVPYTNTVGIGGNGQYLTALNGQNITSGTISNTQIAAATIGHDKLTIPPLTNNHSAAVTLMDSLTLGKQLTAGPYAVTAGTYTGIHGGLSNRITSGLYSFIAGGLSNTLADFVGSFILGGSHNTAKGAPINVSILNGSYNMMDGPDYSLIGGGWSNTVMNGYFTTILNGQNNYIGLSAPSPNIGNATILGGISNNLTAPGTWAMGNYLTNSTTNTIDVGLSDDTKTTFSASGVHMRSSLLTVGDAIGSNVINLSGDQGFIGAGQAGFVFRDTTSSIHVPGGVEFSGTNIAVGTIPSNRLAFAVATPTQVADATNASSIRAITAQQTNQAAILALTAQQTNYATLITMLGPLTNGLGGGAIGGTYQWTNDVNADGNNLYELATIYGSSNSSALTLTGSSAAQDNAISIYRTNSGNGISYFSQIGHEFSGPVSFVDGVGNISAGTLAATGNVTATGTSNYVAALHTDVLSLSELNAAQFNATNTVFVGNARYATNAAVIAPNFALGVQLWATNAAFTFGLPININRTNFESCVVFVTNSTAAAVSITPPAAVKTQGTWYCTNVSTFTFSHYGGLWTNAVALPLW